MPGFSPQIPVTPERLAISNPNNVGLEVLRLDRLHPVISGNKWYKLRYHLDTAIDFRANRIVTFGGAWSNHIVATAAACKEIGIPCVGIIRGEEPKILSETLITARSLNMELRFISRSDYKEKDSMPFVDQANVYVIPEGGFGETGARGAATMLEGMKNRYTHIVCAVGTGTMLAGLSLASNPSCSIIGIPVIKGDGDLQKNISQLTNTKTNWRLLQGFEFGGYAKKTTELISFMNEWYAQTGIPTDFVYTGKLFYAVNHLLTTSYFDPGSRVLVIHSGGLQGNASLPNGTLIF